jgi:membrane protein DedA with SNARE-associated domain/membrane-associated phospholipid phosphatase
MLDFFQRMLESYGYYVVALIVFVEGAGIPLPGETILLLAGAYAGAGNLDVRGVILAAALGAIGGDNLGYFLGWRGGRALLVRYGHALHVGESHLARAEAFYARHGTKTVFFARFIAVLRTLSSLLAGANRMPYRRFAPWNAAGGIVWAVVIGSLGSLFGSQWRQVAHWIGRIGVLLALTALVVVLVLMFRRRSRAAGGLVPFVRARFSPKGYLGLQLTIGVLLVVLAGIVFSGVARIVRHTPAAWIDRTLAAAVAPPSGGLTSLMAAASFVGKPGVILLLATGLAAFFAYRRQGSDVVLVALAVGGAEGLNPLLKLLFARHRPGLADLVTYSFPSGHATGSMALFGLLAYLALRAGGPVWRRALAVGGALVAVFLIGASRVYLGEHYPTDVVGGWAVGLVWLASAITAIETWRRRGIFLREQQVPVRSRPDILSPEGPPRGGAVPPSP